MKDIAEQKKGFDKSAYDMEYARTKTRVIPLRLNKEKDADIIKHLSSKPNVNGYLKRLIRDDIGKSE